MDATTIYLHAAVPFAYLAWSVQIHGVSTLKHVFRLIVPRPIRNWLRSPRRSLRVIWDELRFLIGARPTAKVRVNWTVRCHPAALRVVIGAQATDPDQREELDAFIDRCEPGMILFDLGAHFGVFTLAALRYGGAKARVVAVEPSPSACRMLRIQSALNEGKNRVRVVQAAAAIEPGTHNMIATGVIADGYFVANSGGRPQADLTEVRAVSIDSLVDETGLRPTHLKIDVEGQEADVIRGGQSLLSAGDSPLVFLELHRGMLRDQGRSVREPLEILTNFGYSRFLHSSGPAEIDQLANGDEPLVRILVKKD